MTQDNGARTDATWTCEVGPADRAKLPDGADFPMRQAVRRAFHDLTGDDPERLSSGWGRLPDAAELDRLRAGLREALMMPDPGADPTPKDWDKFVKARQRLFALAEGSARDGG